MHYPRLSSLFRSLRFKLTVLNSVVVLVASVASLVAMREGLRYALQQEADQVLAEEASEISLAVSQLYSKQSDLFNLLDRKAAVHKEHGWFFEIVPEQGDPLWRSENFPSAVGPRSAEAKRSPSTKVIGTYRIVEHETDADGRNFWVRVGASSDFVQRDVDKLTQLMLPVGLIFVLLSPLGGFLLAGRATAPFQEIIATTGRLRPSRLQERLPIRGTGDELDQLSLEINNLLDQIASYLSRHREFVSDAAHELRSPLAALQSSIEVALGKPRKLEQYEDLLLEISGECRQLGILVNQLLLLAETEGGVEETREPVHLDEVVKRSCDMFEAVAEEASLTLACHIKSPAVVLGDQSRLRQVVNNLIDNALKFTPERGRIDVTVEPRSEEGQVVLTVADTGVGIPPQAISHVFNRFYQVDKSRQRSDAKRGSGLGLSICKSIVTAHGGRIEVESVIGKGTTFSVTLPMAQH